MKISKKRIIAIVIVAAVAAWLLWKKGVFAGGKAAVGPSAAKEADDDDTPVETGLTESQIIDRLTQCPDSHKKYLRSKVNTIYADPELKRSVQEKAANNGTTFAKQAVMDASWMVYRTGDNATAGWAKQTHQAICAEVQAM